MNHHKVAKLGTLQATTTGETVKFRSYKAYDDTLLL